MKPARQKNRASAAKASPAPKILGGLAAVAPSQAAEEAEAPASAPQASRVAEEASPRPTMVNAEAPPDLQALAQNEWNAKFEFALGMALGTLHHLRNSGVDPVMASQAMLRAAGMGMEFYGVADRIHPAVEILRGREKQASFQAEQRAVQGQQPS